MNRTPMSAVLIPASKKKNSSGIGSRRIATTARRVANRTPHRLLAPQNYERGYGYPLVVWLHGANGSEADLLNVMPHVSLQNFVAVAPRGTSASLSHDDFYGWRQTPDDINEATDRVLDCIELASDRLHVNRELVFIAGYDQGGTMAMRLGIANPEMFAGAISIGGPLPKCGRLFRSINEARRLPILLASAPEVSGPAMEQTRSDLRTLHSGGFKVELRLYPPGEGLYTEMLADMNKWVMNQFCGAEVFAAS